MPDQIPAPPPAANENRPRVLSGMRPTGRLHLGNYMGALKNWVDLQNEQDAAGNPKYDCYFFIADWHALTTDYADPSRLKQNVFEVALDFLSAGLDPQRSTIFIQSHVPQHAELNLLLSMITPLSWLERVPTYKDQQEQLKEKDLATFGFLGYPLLQSADILLYRPEYVPVGADQVAHVEITREIARRFNFFYPRGGRTEAQGRHEGDQPRSYARWDGEALLPEPEAKLTPSPKLPGTDGRKMSKSYGNTILLTDRLPVVLEKTHGMSKLGQRPLQTDPGDPDLCPVGDMHHIFSEAAVDQQIRIGCTTATIGCADCKQLAGLSIFRHLGPIQAERDRLEQSPDLVWDALDAGSARATEVAEHTMAELRAVTGLSRGRSGVRVDQAALPAQDRTDIRDLTRHEAWWSLDPKLLTRNLRELWRTDVVPPDVALKADTDGVWLTPNHRRVFVAAAAQDPASETWNFAVKPRSYELLVLLCWDAERRLHDFVIPQKLYLAPWTQAKKAAGKGDLTFHVSRRADQYLLCLPSAEIDITAMAGNYSVLST